MSGNCPFCPPDYPTERWGMSPEGLQAAGYTESMEELFSEDLY